LSTNAGKNCFTGFLYLTGNPIDEYDDYGFKGDPGDLPHRYPFLLVDKIIELEPRQRIVGIKQITINEHFCRISGSTGYAGFCKSNITGETILTSRFDDRDSKIPFSAASRTPDFEASCPRRYFETRGDRVAYRHPGQRCGE
jgi:hypothetical protein